MPAGTFFAMKIGHLRALNVRKLRSKRSRLRFGVAWAAASLTARAAPFLTVAGFAETALCTGLAGFAFAAAGLATGSALALAVGAFAAFTGWARCAFASKPPV